jgi:drug/metabolite transporter (DMT)-like permease
VSALLIAFAGCVLTVGVIDTAWGALGSVSPVGVAADVASAFGYAFLTIIGKFALKKYHPITANAYAFAVAFIMLAPFCDTVNMTALLGISVNWQNMLALGIFMTAVPFVCYSRGLRDIEPSRASTIAFIEPFVAAVVGLITYDEMLTPLKILGMALIFVSMVILNLKKAA